MLKKIVFALVAISLPILQVADLPAKKSIESEMLKQFYGSIIDEMNEKSKCANAMLESRCEKIRIASTLSCLKNHYWSNNREELVEEMCKEDFGLDRSRVLVFLNRKFHRVARERGLDLHSQSPLAALPKEPVDGFAKMKINEFCRYYCLPTGMVVSALEENGFEAKEGIALKRIAEEKSVQPEKIYRLIRRK